LSAGIVLDSSTLPPCSRAGKYVDLLDIGKYRIHTIMARILLTAPKQILGQLIDIVGVQCFDEGQAFVISARTKRVPAAISGYENHQ
jgi:hypothetical protein